MSQARDNTRHGRVRDSRSECSHRWSVFFKARNRKLRYQTDRSRTNAPLTASRPPSLAAWLAPPRDPCVVFLYCTPSATVYVRSIAHTLARPPDETGQKPPGTSDARRNDTHDSRERRVPARGRALSRLSALSPTHAVHPSSTDDTLHYGMSNGMRSRASVHFAGLHA
jgi:hypothetical protein